MDELERLKIKEQEIKKGLEFEKDNSVRNGLLRALDKVQLSIEAIKDSMTPATTRVEVPETISIPTPAPTVVKEKKTTKMAQAEEPSGEIIQFAQILQSFMGKSLDEKKVSEISKKVFDSSKVGLNQLSDEIIQEFKTAKKIHLVVPNVETKPVKQSSNKWFYTLIDDVMLHNNIYIWGEAGSGKTTVAKEVARALGRDIETINCSQWTSPIEIIGGYTVDGAVMGKLITAWRDGKILILDEMPKLDPNTAGLLNDALALSGDNDPERNKISDFFGNKYSRHPNFCCIATGNVYPNSYDPSYPANNKQDLSLLDRFSGSVYESPLNINDMKGMVAPYVFDICVKLRTVVTTNKYEAVFSFRTANAFKSAWERERTRLKEPDGINVDEGKTFLKALDSYIDTFNNEQIKAIRNAINYNDIAKNYRSVMIKE